MFDHARATKTKCGPSGHLLKREAEKNGIAPSTYVTNWMNAWTGTVTINGQTVPAAQRAHRPHVLAALRRRQHVVAAAQGAVLAPRHRQPSRPEEASPARRAARRRGPFRLRHHRRLTEQSCVPDHAIRSDLDRHLRVLAGQGGREPGTRFRPPLARPFEPERLDLPLGAPDLDGGGRQQRPASAHPHQRRLDIGRWGGHRQDGIWREFEPNATTKFMQRSTIKQAPTMALAGDNSQLMSDWIWTNRARSSPTPSTTRSAGGHRGRSPNRRLPATRCPIRSRERRRGSEGASTACALPTSSGAGPSPRACRPSNERRLERREVSFLDGHVPRVP